VKSYPVRVGESFVGPLGRQQHIDGEASLPQICRHPRGVESHLAVKRSDNEIDL